MTNAVRLLRLLALAALLGAPLFAASLAGTPGPGQPLEPWDAVRRGMAGAGEALVDRTTQSVAAPARNAFNASTAFQLNVSYEEAALERAGDRQAVDAFTFGALEFSVPIGFLGHIGVAYWPSASVDIDLGGEDGRELSVKGTLQELTAMWSVRVPFVERLALGFAWRQTMGAETTDMSWPLDPDDPEPVNATAEIDYSHKVRSSGGRPSFSFFWMGRRMNLAAWWNPSYTLERKLDRAASIDENVGTFGYSAPFYASDRPRDVESEREEWKQEMPWNAGAALSLRLTRTQSLHLDFFQEDWGAEKGWLVPATPYAASRRVALETSRRFSLGWTYEGSGRAYDSFWKRSRYRTGVRWADLAEPGMGELAGAVGCGFALGRRGALVDLAVEAGRRYSEDGLDPDETFVGIHFGMTGIGQWGQRARGR